MARARLEHNNRMVLAWHIAALGNAKRLPPLQRLLEPEPRTRRRGAAQTPDEQRRIAWLINSMFGGKVEKRASN